MSVYESEPPSRPVKPTRRLGPADVLYALKEDTPAPHARLDAEIPAGHKARLLDDPHQAEPVEAAANEANTELNRLKASDMRPEPEREVALLTLAAALLPREARKEWVEEHRRYMADLPKRRDQTAWVLSLIRGLPRQIVAMRSARSSKEPV